jgi:hypothetical protein
VILVLGFRLYNCTRIFSEKQNAPIYVLFKPESGRHIHIAQLSRVATEVSGGPRQLHHMATSFYYWHPPYGLRNQTTQ